MTDINYDIDKTENEYIHFEGDTLSELKEFLYSDSVFKDCCGYITYVNSNANMKADLAIAVLNGYGVYLGFCDEEHVYLSVADRLKLCNVLDVWGDGLYVSEGLFISPQLAWKGICEFVKTGKWCKEIEWIMPEDLPDEGNYIC